MISLCDDMFEELWMFSELKNKQTKNCYNCINVSLMTPQEVKLTHRKEERHMLKVWHKLTGKHEVKIKNNAIQEAAKKPDSHENK